MTPLLSLIVPTRERATYLFHCLRTCLASDEPGLEVLVMDNASSPETRAVVERVGDPRLRYLRSDTRLSMRDNFERGLDAARGEIICFLGDDDGILPGAVAEVISTFAALELEALSAARAHYFWPDLQAVRRNTSLLPRGRGIVVQESRTELRKLLSHNDYYRLPCLYHGFVRRTVADRIRQRQGGRFFMSNNADIYSAIALSMEGLRFAYSGSPLVINGASGRSNGASHFAAGAGGNEKSLWHKEDDLGFLPGFDGSMLMSSFIIDSTLRFARANPRTTLDDAFGVAAVREALEQETRLRLAAGWCEDAAYRPFATSGLERPAAGRMRWVSEAPSRPRKLLRAFLMTRPIDMQAEGISNIADAAILLGGLRTSRQVGLLHAPVRQVCAALRMARA